MKSQNNQSVNQPVTEPVTKPVEPIVKPDTPEKRPSKNPFRRTPNVKPGEEPKPKAFIKTLYEWKNKMIKESLLDSINAGTADKIRKGNHSYAKHQAFIDGQFATEISELRLEELKKKLAHYAGIEEFDTISLYKVVLSAVQKIEQIEAEHRSDLEQLAIKLVSDELNVPEGTLIFDAKITGISDLNFKKEMELDQEEDEEMSTEVADSVEQVLEDDEEVLKRRFINGLISGSSNKGHYMFNLVDKELSKIDPNLVTLYGSLMTANDLNYWLFDENLIKAAADAGSGMGVAKVKKEGEQFKIVARGINFPSLVHELIKGVMEYLSMFGLPKRKYLLKKTDLLEEESWDLRFGPQLWDRFVDAIGFDDLDIKEHLYVHLVEMPAKEFNDFMLGLMRRTPEAKKQLATIATDIKKEIAEEDNFKQDDIDDIDISDIFNETMKIGKEWLKNGKITQAQLDRAVELDPTKEKKWVGWICKVLLANGEPDRFLSYLQEYETFIKSGRIDKKDINQFKTFDQLKEEVDQINSQKSASLKELKTNYDTIQDDANLLICRPNSHEASRYLGLSKFAFRDCGDGTKDSAWCTTFGNNGNFMQYFGKDMNTFYYIRIKNNAWLSKCPHKSSGYNGKPLKGTESPWVVMAMQIHADGKMDAWDGTDTKLTSGELIKYKEIIGFFYKSSTFIANATEKSIQLQNNYGEINYEIVAADQASIKIEGTELLFNKKGEDFPDRLQFGTSSDAKNAFEILSNALNKLK